MKRSALRYCLNNICWKSIIIFCFMVISFTIFIACFINRVTIIPSTTSKNNEEYFLKLHSSLGKVPLFPLVKEFVLSPKIRKFDNENARVVGFPDKSYGNLTLLNLSKKIIYLATPYFTEWNSKHYYTLHLGSTTFDRYSCPVSNCYVTKDPTEGQKADALLFHIRDLDVFSIPRHRTPEQVWILYSMEPPWLEIRDMRRFNGMFNWTMSYRRESDLRMSYGFIGRKPNPIGSPPQQKKMLANLRKKENKAVWFVSNCRTDSNREGYVDRLRKVYPVDIFGGCGMEACRPAETEKCYSRIERRYKFYLAFENAVCRDYVTEKLFNSLEYFMVPVAFGGANYSNLTPKDSIINAMDFENPEDLGRYLWTVSNDDELYLSHFRWKNEYRSYLQPWMCDLCEKLHDSSNFKSNNHLDEWWNEGYTCLRWHNEGFKQVEQYNFPVYHSKLFN